jgi:flagellar basal body rod protein FlgC
MITPISAIAQQGIERSLADASRAAQAIVERGPSSNEEAAADEVGLRDDQFVRGIVDLTKAQTSLEANVAVFRTADELTGTLLDILA